MCLKCMAQCLEPRKHQHTWVVTMDVMLCTCTMPRVLFYVSTHSPWYEKGKLYRNRNFDTVWELVYFILLTWVLLASRSSKPNLWVNKASWPEQYCAVFSLVFFMMLWFRSWVSFQSLMFLEGDWITGVLSSSVDWSLWSWPTRKYLPP